MSEGRRDSGTADVTALLRAWAGGNEAALEEVMGQLYGELKLLARRQLRRERDATLQPTALVHELYLRMRGTTGVDWQDRGHFYAIASRVMRRLLVEDGRRRRAAKRRALHVALEEDAASTPARDVDMLALDEALTALERRYPRQARVVELRYFGGLTHEEVASCLGMSVETIKLDWRFARNWLRREMQKGNAAGKRSIP